MATRETGSRRDEGLSSRHSSRRTGAVIRRALVVALLAVPAVLSAVPGRAELHIDRLEASWLISDTNFPGGANDETFEADGSGSLEASFERVTSGESGSSSRADYSIDATSVQIDFDIRLVTENDSPTRRAVLDHRFFLTTSEPIEYEIAGGMQTGESIIFETIYSVGLRHEPTGPFSPGPDYGFNFFRGFFPSSVPEHDFSLADPSTAGIVPVGSRVGILYPGEIYELGFYTALSTPSGAADGVSTASGYFSFETRPIPEPNTAVLFEIGLLVRSSKRPERPGRSTSMDDFGDRIGRHFGATDTPPATAIHRRNRRIGNIESGAVGPIETTPFRGLE